MVPVQILRSRDFELALIVLTKMAEADASIHLRRPFRGETERHRSEALGLPGFRMDFDRGERRHALYSRSPGIQSRAHPTPAGDSEAESSADLRGSARRGTTVLHPRRRSDFRKDASG